MTATTLSPSEASTAQTTLEELLAALSDLFDQIFAFPGDPSLVSDFLNQADVLSTLVSTLQGRLPAISSVDITDAQDQVQTLKDEYSSFLVLYDCKFYKFYLHMCIRLNRKTFSMFFYPLLSIIFVAESKDRKEESFHEISRKLN